MLKKQVVIHWNVKNTPGSIEYVKRRLNTSEVKYNFKNTPNITKWHHLGGGAKKRQNMNNSIFVNFYTSFWVLVSCIYILNICFRCHFVNREKMTPKISKCYFLSLFPMVLFKGSDSSFEILLQISCLLTNSFAEICKLSQKNYRSSLFKNFQFRTMTNIIISRFWK